MATGVWPKEKKPRKNIPISVTYEGKTDPAEVFSMDYLPFEEIAQVKKNSSNRFFYGDNLDALLYLRSSGWSGKVNLIYIDPPFATRSSFVSRDQTHAYSDHLSGGEYVEFLRERLLVLHDLLADTGSIYLHLDSNMAFTMKLIMDEIFGEHNCRAFITRKKCSTKNFTRNTYGNIADYIMFYSKTANYTWHRPYEPWDLERMLEQYPCIDEKTGRRYKKVPIHAPGIRNGDTGKMWRGKLPPRGKHWQYTPQKLDELDAAGEIYWSPSGNPRRMVFCDPEKGIPRQDIWMDFRDSVNQSLKTTGYPTEKNFDMLKVIVEASSDPGDLVMDCFSGSGTTLGAAFELNRQWIGVDNSPESLRAVLKRFTSGLEVYGDYVSTGTANQCSFDLNTACSFNLWANPDTRAEALQILSEAAAPSLPTQSHASGGESRPGADPDKLTFL